MGQWRGIEGVKFDKFDENSINTKRRGFTVILFQP
jgi:hypothetical protein